MATQFERTTVSFTESQMKAMKKLVDDGEYPDLTEATRAAVNLFLDLKKCPSIAHAFCCASIRHGACLKLREECKDCTNIQKPEIPMEKVGDLDDGNCTKRAMQALFPVEVES